MLPLTAPESGSLVLALQSSMEQVPWPCHPLTIFHSVDRHLSGGKPFAGGEGLAGRGLQQRARQRRHGRGQDDKWLKHHLQLVQELEQANQGEGFDVLFYGDSIMESTRQGTLSRRSLCYPARLEPCLHPLDTSTFRPVSTLLTFNMRRLSCMRHGDAACKCHIMTLFKDAEGCGSCSLTRLRGAGGCIRRVIMHACRGTLSGGAWTDFQPVKQAWDEAFADKPYTTHALAFAGARVVPHRCTSLSC